MSIRIEIRETLPHMAKNAVGILRDALVDADHEMDEGYCADIGRAADRGDTQGVDRLRRLRERDLRQCRAMLNAFEKIMRGETASVVIEV